MRIAALALVLLLGACGKQPACPPAPKAAPQPAPWNFGFLAPQKPKEATPKASTEPASKAAAPKAPAAAKPAPARPAKAKKAKAEKPKAKPRKTAAAPAPVRWWCSLAPRGTTAAEIMSEAKRRNKTVTQAEADACAASKR